MSGCRGCHTHLEVLVFVREGHRGLLHDFVLVIRLPTGASVRGRAANGAGYTWAGAFVPPRNHPQYPGDHHQGVGVVPRVLGVVPGVLGVVPRVLGVVPRGD